MNDSTQLDTTTINYILDTTNELKRNADASNKFDLGITLILIAFVLYLGAKKQLKK